MAEVVLAFQLATERQGWAFDLALDDEIAAHLGLPPAVDITFMKDVPERLPLRPDAHVVIDAGDGAKLNYLVEVDLGTEPQIRSNLRTSSILRKAIAYWQMSFWRPLPADGVIFVTTSAKRIAGMIEQVRRVDPKNKGSHFFHFALLDDCRIENHEALFYSPLFRSSKIGYDNPRRLLLDTCAACNQFVDPSNESYRILNSQPAPDLAFAAGASPLPEHLPIDEEPEYAHFECPGLTLSQGNR